MKDLESRGQRDLGAVSRLVRPECEPLEEFGEGPPWPGNGRHYCTKETVQNCTGLYGRRQSSFIRINLQPTWDFSKIILVINLYYINIQ